MRVPAYLDMETFYEAQRKKDDMKRMMEQAKLQEVTGKPRISHKSHSLSRDVKDLYSWQKEVQKKKQDLLRQK